MVSLVDGHFPIRSAINRRRRSMHCPFIAGGGVVLIDCFCNFSPVVSPQTRFSFLQLDRDCIYVRVRHGLTRVGHYLSSVVYIYLHAPN